MLYLVGLLIISVLVLFVFRQLKVRYVFSWLLGITVCLVVFGGILALQIRIPQEIPLLRWQGVGLDAPMLVLDDISWPFGLALAGLGVGVVLTGAQRLADASQQDENGTPVGEDWQNLGAVLGLLALGLLGVFSGNPLTFLLTWAGVDFLTLWILLVQLTGREHSEQIVIDFSARAAGVLLLIWGMAASQAEGTPLQLDRISPGVNVFLLLACGLRLGILPLQVSFLQDFPLRRGVGTMTRLTTPVLVSLALLARIAPAGVPAGLVVLLLVLTGLTGVYAGFHWLMAKNEMEGLPFWVLGMGALAVASAIQGQALAVQAWGLALLLAGGALFLFSARSPGTRILVGINGVMISGLPWMPTMNGNGLYAGDFEWAVLPFILIHALLLAGFIRHLLRVGEEGQGAVRAVRAAYHLGLLVLPGTLFLAGATPDAVGNGVSSWASLVGVGIVALMGIWVWRGGRISTTGLFVVVQRVFSFQWLYRLLWRGYRLLGGVIVFVSLLLEGEAGVLWALLLLFLLLSLITAQAGLGG